MKQRSSVIASQRKEILNLIDRTNISYRLDYSLHFVYTTLECTKGGGLEG